SWPRRLAGTVGTTVGVVAGFVVAGFEVAGFEVAGVVTVGAGVVTVGAGVVTVGVGSVADGVSTGVSGLDGEGVGEGARAQEKANEVVTRATIRTRVTSGRGIAASLRSWAAHERSGSSGHPTPIRAQGRSARPAGPSVHVGAP